MAETDPGTKLQFREVTAARWPGFERLFAARGKVKVMPVHGVARFAL
jgi:hypothetical protein